MDIFDYYSKNISEAEKQEYDKFKPEALKFSQQGFDEDMTSELLVVRGCSKTVAKKLAEIGQDTLPAEYIFCDPPKNVEDVSKKAIDSIRNAPIEKLETYIKKYRTKEEHAIIDRIKTARSMNLDSLYKEVYKDIKPIIDSSILNNRAYSRIETAENISEKETLEQELWGVWPIFLIQRHARNQVVAKKIRKVAFKKTKDEMIWDED